MIVVERIPEVREAVRLAKRQGLSIGFVPTMGALHTGHVSLMKSARRDCGFTALSIFVNPTQFGPHEDFQKYPRPRAADLKLCEHAGVDLVFYPSVEEIYPADASTFVEVAGISEIGEGAIRPGHFRGVATVVTKLFNIVQPDRAYFGQKDYQQQLLLRRMSRDLNLPVEVVTCPIIRAEDGLALSSRNAYLSASERQAGLALSQALRDVESAILQGEHHPQHLQKLMQQRIQNTPGIVLEYALIADPETLQELNAPQSRMVALLAAKVGTTRLIDNQIFNIPG